MFFFIYNKSGGKLLGNTYIIKNPSRYKKIAQILTDNYELLHPILQGSKQYDKLIDILIKNIPEMNKKQVISLLESADFLCELSDYYNFLGDKILFSIPPNQLRAILSDISGEALYYLLKDNNTVITMSLPASHPVYNFILNKRINELDKLLNLLLDSQLITKEAYKLYKYNNINAGYLSDFANVYAESTYNNDMTYIVYYFIYLLENYDSNDNLELIQENVNNIMHYFSNSHIGTYLETAFIQYIIRLNRSQLSASGLSIIESFIDKKDQYSQYSSKKLEYIRDLLKLETIIYKIDSANYSSASLKLLTNMIKDINYNKKVRQIAVDIYNQIIYEFIPSQFIKNFTIDKKNLCSR